MSYRDEIVRSSQASIVEKDFAYQYTKDSAFRAAWDEAVSLKDSVMILDTAKNYKTLLDELSANPVMKVAIDEILLPLLNANSLWSKDEYLNILVEDTTKQSAFKKKFDIFTNVGAFGGLFLGSGNDSKSLIHGYTEGKKIAEALEKGQRYSANLKDKDHYLAAYILYVIMSFFKENEELYLYDSIEPEKKVFRLKFLLNSIRMDMFSPQRNNIFFKVLNEKPTFSHVPIVSPDAMTSSFVDKYPYKIIHDNSWFRFTFTVNDDYNNSLSSKRDIHKFYKFVHDSLMKFKNLYEGNSNRQLGVYRTSMSKVSELLKDIATLSNYFSFTQFPPEKMTSSKTVSFSKTSLSEESLRIIKSLPALAVIEKKSFYPVIEYESQYLIDIESISYFEKFTKNPVMTDGFATQYDLYESLNNEEKQAILEPVNNTGMHQTRWTKAINNHRFLRRFLFLIKPNISYTLRSAPLCINYYQDYETASIKENSSDQVPIGSRFAFKYCHNANGIYHVPYFQRKGEAVRSERVGTGVFYDTEIITLSFLKRIFPLVYSDGNIYDENKYLNQKEQMVKAQLQEEVNRLELTSLQAVGELDVERGKVLKLQEELKRAIEARNSSKNNINDLMNENVFLKTEIEKVRQEVDYQYQPLLQAKKEALERQTR